jgi:hypothetical protein
MRDNDVAALKSENADLREQLRHAEARLEAVENKLTPKPRQVAPVDEGVRVTFLRTASIEMPTTEQFRDLLRVVKRCCPTLVPNFDDRSVATEFGNGFIGAFQIISDQTYGHARQA